MAKGDPIGDILTLGIVAGGAYLIWNWWVGTAAAATAANNPSTPAPTTPGSYTPPSLTQAMQAAANSNSIIQAQGGQADAYQWSTLWSGIGQTPISDVNTIFFPSGLPANAAAVTAAGGVASQQGLPLMSLATFLTALSGHGINTTGLSGLGQARLIPVPVVLPGKTKTTIQLPAGTTPAMLQAQLRAYRANQ